MVCIAPCGIFTLYSLPKLRRTMRAHQSLWMDMANQFHVDRPPISLPPISMQTHSSGDPSSSGADSTPPHLEYGLVEVHTPHTPSALEPSSSNHVQSTRNSTLSSIYVLEKFGTDIEDVAIVRLANPSHSMENDETEAPIGRGPSRMDGDVSSYGGALGIQNPFTCLFFL